MHEYTDEQTQRWTAWQHGYAHASARHDERMVTVLNYLLFGALIVIAAVTALR